MTTTALPKDAAAAAGLCWECGYPLRGLESRRCPECGRPFDPTDPATMNMGQQVGPVTRSLLRPPGWPLYALTALAALTGVWAAASPAPGGRLGFMLHRVAETAYWTTWRHALGQVEQGDVRYAYAAIAWLVVAAAWGARRVARGVAVRRIAPGQRAAPGAYWRRWLAPPVALVLAALFCMTPGPVHLGFWASKPSIDAARRNWAGPPPPSVGKGVRWVGVYPVDVQKGLRAAPHLGGDGMNLINASDFGGFVYAPDGPPTSHRGYVVRRVGGGWYRFHRASAYH